MHRHTHTQCTNINMIQYEIYLMYDINIKIR